MRPVHITVSQHDAQILQGGFLGYPPDRSHRLNSLEGGIRISF